jgi:hypothetical protein
LNETQGFQGIGVSNFASAFTSAGRSRRTPLMSDGTVGPILELRPLFEQYQRETS